MTSPTGSQPAIAITTGDPAGVGPEIVIQAIAAPEVRQLCRPVVFADLPVLQRAMQSTGVHVELQAYPGDPSLPAVEFVDVKAGGERSPIGQISPEGGAAAFRAIELAVDHCRHGEMEAMATAPINKESFRAAQVPYLDHTAALQALTGARAVLTLFVTGDLRVFFATRHLRFREIARYITSDNLIAFGHECARQMLRLGFPSPRLAVAALNPHGGEHGLFGDEEINEIGPAVESLRAAGLTIDGPIPADSVFHLAMEGAYDAVISLYHDQGHIATKTLDFYRTVSLTLGLPFLRTSVDHGTAFNIAGTGRANPISMIESIRAAAVYGPSWRRNEPT